MALVRRFEDLAAWQEARRLARHTYEATRGRAFAADRSLVSQFRRAAISTVTNIAEGFGSGTKAEFRRFLRYAIRSTVEVQACLYLAVDQHYLTKREFSELHASAERLKSLCSALVRKLGERSAETQRKPERVAEASPPWAQLGCLPAPPHVSTSARQHVSTLPGQSGSAVSCRLRLAE